MKKRLIALFTLIAVVTTCALSFIGCSNGSAGLEYTLLEDESSYMCSGIGTCNKADITIASRYKGKKVTEIKPIAFRDCTSLESVTIPGSVTTIGAGAFETCYSLRSVNIKNGVTSIDGSAFSSCPSLSSINIPDSVTYIANTAFDGSKRVKHKENGLTYVDRWVIECESSIDNLVLRDDTRGIAEITFRNLTNLTDVTLPESLLYIGRSAFFECKRITEVTIPDSVVLIDKSAFAGCSSINSVTIGKNVVTIGDYAFSDCESLESVAIPGSVTTIGENALMNCNSLTSIIVDENNKSYKSADGVLYTKDGTTLLQYPQGITAERFVIPDSVTTIGIDALMNCNNLTNVTIGNSVTNIVMFAFSYCNNLKSITYNGTMQEWNAIEKGPGWYFGSDFTITCTDGTLDMDGNVIS